MGRHEISPGAVFGRWTVMSEGNPRKNKFGHDIRTIRCKCSCDKGEIRDVLLHNLIRGISKSCGCHRSDVTTRRSTAHGNSGHPLYGVWTTMKYRAGSPRGASYESYRSLGISVCEEWRSSFSAFFEWAMTNGWKRGLTIDRIDNSKGYSPGNCRVVPLSVNCQNKRTTRNVTAYGRTMCVTEWARLTKQSHKAICNRIDRGISAELAVLKVRSKRDETTGRMIGVHERCNDGEMSEQVKAVMDALKQTDDGM